MTATDPLKLTSDCSKANMISSQRLIIKYLLKRNNSLENWRNFSVSQSVSVEFFRFPTNFLFGNCLPARQLSISGTDKIELYNDCLSPGGCWPVCCTRRRCPSGCRWEGWCMAGCRTAPPGCSPSGPPALSGNPQTRLQLQIFVSCMSFISESTNC